MIQKLNFGEIWLADLNPRFGSEPGKVRPVLIIQSQVLLDVEHPSVIIIPLTTNLINDAEPLRIRIERGDKLDKESDVLIDQIRAIDLLRLREGPIATCKPDLMTKIQNALSDVFGFERETNDPYKMIRFYKEV